MIPEVHESIARLEQQQELLFSLGLSSTTKPAPRPIPPVRVSTPTSVPPVSPSKALRRPIPPLLVSPAKSLKEVDFPLKEAKSLKGIISYLTRKHGGNVHDKGIVTITSKSVRNDQSWCAARNVADLTSDSSFLSKNEPGQWICWDFHEMRVRPTHYTIKSWFLKSLVVDRSLDGEAWTEIDRQTNNEDFNSDWWVTASFAVAKSAECRFIRLTQTGKSHWPAADLRIRAFAFGSELRSIGQFSFGNSSLTSIFIPQSVYFIHSSPFCCKSLASVCFARHS
jgi:hypothetical protein